MKELMAFNSSAAVASLPATSFVAHSLSDVHGKELWDRGVDEMSPAFKLGAYLRNGWDNLFNFGVGAAPAQVKQEGYQPVTVKRDSKQYMEFQRLVYVNDAKALEKFLVKKQIEDEDFDVSALITDEVSGYSSMLHNALSMFRFPDSTNPKETIETVRTLMRNGAKLSVQNRA